MHHILTLGHHRIEMIEQTLRNAQRLATGKYKWHFLWQHYPLPNKTENTARAYELARDLGLHLYDAGVGLGCNKGIHYLLDHINPVGGDFVTIFDPDERVTTFGWDEALTAVASDPRYPIVSVKSPQADMELAEVPVELFIVNGHCVVAASVPKIMSIVCFDWTWWQSVGAYADSGRWYGGMEAHTWPALEATGKQMVYLRDVWTTLYPPSRLFVDRHYTDWKWLHAHHDYDGSFEDLLTERCVTF